MQMIIISGLSGAGKSTAGEFLEDEGFYTIDNMPALLMPRFAELCLSGSGGYDKVAMVSDIRGGKNFDELFCALDTMREMGIDCKLLFLEASVPAIIKRFKETRRSHPLCSDGCSIESAVSRERELLRSVRETADVVLDTSAFSTAKLRSTLLSLFAAAEKGALHVNVLSFGFKNGLPPEANLVLDVRFLPNPYYVPELKALNGLDAPVRDYVLRSEQTAEFLRRLMPLVEFLLPQYRQEGRTELVIAVGCTGGRHRSVAVARYLSEFAAHLGYPVTESHRDMNR